MEVSARIGGDPSLTAVFVIVTGMIGAMVVPAVFRRFGIHDARARGLGLGVAAHGLGTARAVTLGATELSFVVTPLLVPWLARLFEA
jgi:putative effector of murein hydrolase